MTTIEHILEVIKPGERISYNTLLVRLKETPHPPQGVMVALQSYASKNHGLFQYQDELAIWYRERVHVEGAWQESDLWVARRPAKDLGAYRGPLGSQESVPVTPGAPYAEEIEE